MNRGKKGAWKMSDHLRRHVSHDVGTYHIFSKVVGGQHLMDEMGRNYFVKLLKDLAQLYFVKVRAFVVMSNHFHLLVKENGEVGKFATRQELWERYRECFGSDSEPPIGGRVRGEFFVDEDGGEQRLRDRLISISAFVKELKERYSKWHNRNNKRSGAFWGARFKGPIVFNGAPEMVTSAYIEANSVRAGIVKRPEDYKWCSLYHRIRKPKEASKWLFPVCRQDILDNRVGDEPVPFLNLSRVSELEWYRLFVYVSAGKERKDLAHMDPALVDEMIRYASGMDIVGRFCQRIKNFTHGIVIGTAGLVESFQKRERRVHPSARHFLKASWAYATRVLRC